MSNRRIKHVIRIIISIILTVASLTSMATAVSLSRNTERDACVQFLLSYTPSQLTFQRQDRSHLTDQYETIRMSEEDLNKISDFTGRTTIGTAQTTTPDATIRLYQYAGKNGASDYSPSDAHTLAHYVEITEDTMRAIGLILIAGQLPQNESEIVISKTAIYPFVTGEYRWMDIEQGGGSKPKEIKSAEDVLGLTVACGKEDSRKIFTVVGVIDTGYQVQSYNRNDKHENELACSQYTLLEEMIGVCDGYIGTHASDLYGGDTDAQQYTHAIVTGISMTAVADTIIAKRFDNGDTRYALVGYCDTVTENVRKEKGIAVPMGWIGLALWVCALIVWAFIVRNCMEHGKSCALWCVIGIGLETIAAELLSIYLNVLIDDRWNPLVMSTTFGILSEVVLAGSAILLCGAAMWLGRRWYLIRKSTSEILAKNE